MKNLTKALFLLPLCFVIASCNGTDNNKGGTSSQTTNSTTQTTQAGDTFNVNVPKNEINVDEEIEIEITGLNSETPIWQTTSSCILILPNITGNICTVKGLSSGTADINISIGDKYNTKVSITVKDSSSQVSKATIQISNLQNATTTLAAKEYEINKKIEFEVNPRPDYNIVNVKMNDNIITKENNKYSFTPTEAKTYTLSVELEDNPNKVYLDFSEYKDGDLPGTSKGIFFNCLADTGQSSYSDLIKNGKYTLKSGMKFSIVGRYSNVDVWPRRIEFNFASGKDNLSLVSGQDDEKYQDGIWTSNYDYSDSGAASAVFVATGDVEINSILVTTEDFKFIQASININNLDSDDKLYYLKSIDYEKFLTKTLVTKDSKFNAGEVAYFYLESSDTHKKYYQAPYVIDKNGEPLAMQDLGNIPEGTTLDNPRIYLFTPSRESEKNVINFTWTGLNASKSLVIDDQSAIRYIKGYMETQPLNSLNLENVSYGKEIEISLQAKENYSKLAMILNGETIDGSYEDHIYKFRFTLKNADTNNISFTAKEGKETDGNELVLYKEVNNIKFTIKVASLNNVNYLFIESPVDYPMAQVSNVKFNNTAKEFKTREDFKYYELTNDEYNLLTPGGANLSDYFTFDVTDTDSYESKLTFNDNNYSIIINGVAQPLEFNLAGRGIYNITIKPNDNYEFKAIDVNDIRYVKDTNYQFNPDGTITFKFNALRLDNNFVVQTVKQKVLLTQNITTGFMIDGINEEIECGAPVVLEIKPTSDDYFLYGKKITVTYNGTNVSVNTADEKYTFEITPIKTQTEIKVLVEDNS